MSPTKPAEPIEMPFRLWTRVGPRKHVLDGVHIDVTWRIHWTVHVRRRCGFFVKLLWPLVLTATVFCRLVVRPTRQSSNVPVHYFCCSSRLCSISVLITFIGPLTNRCYLCWCRGRYIFSSDNWRQDWVITWPWVSEWVKVLRPTTQ